MVDRSRSIALTTLANLSKTVENRTFSIDEIATRAVQLFSLDYNEARRSLETYLAAAVRRDPDFTGINSTLSNTTSTVPCP